MGIAIVGMAPRDVPWNENWEFWGLAKDPDWVNFHRLFEMHDLSIVRWKDRLEDIFVPLYMQEVHEEYPESIQYPLRQVAQELGDYFTCSIAYMLGLAILENPDEIALFGITGEEDYERQKANLEYLLGFARGRGIKVTIHGGSLLKYQPFRNYGVRYGYVA